MDVSTEGSGEAPARRRLRSRTIPAGRFSNNRLWLAAAASILVVTGGIVAIANLGSDEPGRISPATDPTTTDTDNTTATTPPITSPSSAPEVAPAPPSSTPTTATTTFEPEVTSTTGPEVSTDQNGDGVIAGLSAGVEWEFSGIERTCTVEDADGTAGCTQVVHDPSGVPISYDVTTRTLTRHVRDDGEFVRAVLPESYGDNVWLVTAGPDEVVYLNVTERPGAEGSADLVAVALAPGDAGRELGRVVGGGNPGYDSDFAVTPHGVVMTDWYGSGQRPSADRALVMPWVDRNPNDDDSPEPGVDVYPNGVDSITIDAYEHTVTVNGRTWQLTGQAAEFPATHGGPWRPSDFVNRQRVARLVGPTRR